MNFGGKFSFKSFKSQPIRWPLKTSKTKSLIIRHVADNPYLTLRTISSNEDELIYCQLLMG